MNEIYRGKCWVCGEEFTTVYPSQRYCSKKCRRKSQNARARKLSLRDTLPYATEEYLEIMGDYDEDVLVKRITVVGKSIAEIAKEAQELDMSYGEYVAKYGEQ